MSGELLLSARGIHRVYDLPRRRPFAPRPTNHALRGVDLDVHRGETVGVVGESGSGKSTLARIVIGLDAATEGSITFEGREVRPGPPRALRWLRRDVQIVFQDPASSLDPRMSAAQIIAEPLIGLHVEGNHEARIIEVLEAVGLDPASRHRYPHEFSGGQQQRLAIARALAPRPRLLIADEPVSALDVSVQAQVLDLLIGLRATFDLAMVFVSHDLGVVNELCDSVIVLRDGDCVEHGTTDDVFGAPRHEYTQRLLAAVPRLPPSAPATTG